MNTLKRWLSAGLLVGSIGCNDGGGDTVDQTENDAEKPANNTPPTQNNVDQPSSPPATNNTPAQATPPVSTAVPGNPQVPVSTVLASLSAAADCSDLLTRVQDDAIAKLMMQVELYKKQPPPNVYLPGRPIAGGAVKDAGVAVSSPAPSAPSDDDSAESSSGDGKASGSNNFGGLSGGDPSSGPVGASETNTQVEGVDEADFVKVVDKGAFIYLLHGNTLRKLDSWPAAQTALVGKELTLEGTPSEMFVTDAGKAVVFSTVYSYQSTGGKPVLCDSWSGYCGGYGGYSSLKITVADVSTDTPKVEREIYYEGNYVSSRRYDDVVRAVIQSYSKFSGLYSPQIQWNDAWGRPYEQSEIASQLDEWETRTEASIRKTVLSDWFPVAQEVVNGKLVDIAPGCNSYLVPDPGLSDYGLTHVLSLDLTSPTSAIGGVTVVGSVSTVYSNADKLVLAQPDYRWGPINDFGAIGTQQTAYHVFGLSAAKTTYLASGWLFGTLPAQNQQFGIDVAADGTLRVAATGWVRDNPKADQSSDDFWKQHNENRVLTASIKDGKVTLLGQSEPLGHEGETVQSARFIGDRAYVVTYRQIDPLIVLDVANAAAPKVLGQIEIPGFSQYVHPLDATHLITFGQSGKGGVQLQLFDVTDPTKLPAPLTHDFGQGTSSELSYNHKALTSFEGGLLALPLYGYWYTTPYRQSYSSTLEILRANASTGFSDVASIDHGPLYADNGSGVSCGTCDAFACYDYLCSYQPELRRGHFVKGEDGKIYVYSFSYAGVLVHELGTTAKQVAKVGLPAPVFDTAPFYPVDDVPPDATPPVAARDGGAVTVRDAGVATKP